MNSGFPAFSIALLLVPASARLIGVRMPPESANSVPAPPKAMHFSALRREVSVVMGRALRFRGHDRDRARFIPAGASRSDQQIFITEDGRKTEDTEGVL